MRDTTPAEVAPTALEEAMGLLRRPSGSVKDGYIDLLEQREALGAHRGQRMFRTRLVPLIYERYSRPLASRIFLGLRGPRFAEERRIVLEMLRIEAGDRILDVGCGPGNYTRSFAEAAQGGLVVGLDASPTMLAAAVKRGGCRVAYVRGDGASLPFADVEFDVVGSIGVLHVIEEPMSALDEMVRVLVPGGRLTLATVYGRSAGREGKRFGGHVFGREELTRALAERGMVEIEQRVFGVAQFLAARKAEA